MSTVETHHPLIERALTIVTEEIEIAATERRAFERFRTRTSATEPDCPTAGAATPARSTATAVVGCGAGSTGESLTEIRRAYRETVMAVPHFDSEYGDTLKQSAVTEFGTDIGRQVANGDRLTGRLRGALLTATEAVIDERDTYERNLRQEHESLLEVHNGIADCERRAHALGDAIDDASRSETLGELDGRFATLERECTDLAATRQEVIHGRRSSRISGIGDRSLTALLYGDLETTCPGLTEITRCLETIRSRRRECLR